jgi:hypothetical protein
MDLWFLKTDLLERYGKRHTRNRHGIQSGCYKGL